MERRRKKGREIKTGKGIHLDLLLLHLLHFRASGRR